MSAQTIADAFAPADAKYRAQVMRATWGHLAPKHGKTYLGTMLFAHSAYGDLVPFRTNFKGLPDSPWFYQGMMDFIASCETKPGNLYKFDGKYVLNDDGSHHFAGITRKVKV